MEPDPTPPRRRLKLFR
ncbi:mgtA regulatory leader peptide MgtL [Escherichia coli]